MNTNDSSVKTGRKRFSRPLHYLVCALVIIAVVYGLLSFISRPYDKADNTYIDVTISKGSNTSDIAETLHENGIIGRKGSFTFLSKVLLYNNKFKPGTYSLSPSMNMNSIADTLIDGITTSKGFKLPAGFTVNQTAEALYNAGFSDKDAFISIAESGIFASQFSFLDGSESLEGFLLPGQYEMSKEADESMIIATMLNQFDQFFTEEYRERAKELGLSIRQVVVLASIVEKETSIDKEKGMIASVLLNRISSGLGIEGGFPEIPLCSPSRESIEAVLHADESSYCYYVLDDKLDGSHVYATTKAEYASLKEAYDKAYAAREASKKED